jgi:alkyl hydroperoxide reductase subunit AhpC
MSLRLGDEAPDFRSETTIGPIWLHEYLGDSWGVLFSHPADYTPVCTTELGRAAQLKEEFEIRNVKVLAVSVDPVEKHLGWITDINDTQRTNASFPIECSDEVIMAYFGMNNLEELSVHKAKVADGFSTYRTEVRFVHIIHKGLEAVVGNFGFP